METGQRMQFLRFLMASYLDVLLCTNFVSWLNQVFSEVLHLGLFVVPCILPGEIVHSMGNLVIDFIAIMVPVVFLWSKIDCSGNHMKTLGGQIIGKAICFVQRYDKQGTRNGSRVGAIIVGFVCFLSYVVGERIVLAILHPDLTVARGAWWLWLWLWFCTSTGYILLAAVFFLLSFCRRGQVLHIVSIERQDRVFIEVASDYFAIALVLSFAVEFVKWVNGGMAY